MADFQKKVVKLENAGKKKVKSKKRAFSLNKKPVS